MVLKYRKSSYKEQGGRCWPPPLSILRKKMALDISFVQRKDFFSST